MRKAILMCIIANLALAWVDKEIWGKMFDDAMIRDTLVALYGWGWLGQYWIGWSSIMIWMLLLGNVALFPNWRAMLWFTIATPLLSASGLEDMLYYWLQLQYVPAELPWLNDKHWAFGNATSIGMDISILGHTAFVILMGIGISRIPTLKPPRIQLFNTFVLDS